MLAFSVVSNLLLFPLRKSILVIRAVTKSIAGLWAMEETATAFANVFVVAFLGIVTAAFFGYEFFRTHSLQKAISSYMGMGKSKPTWLLNFRIAASEVFVTLDKLRHKLTDNSSTRHTLNNDEAYLAMLRNKLKSVEKLNGTTKTTVGVVVRDTMKNARNDLKKFVDGIFGSLENILSSASKTVGNHAKKTTQSTLKAIIKEIEEWHKKL